MKTIYQREKGKKRYPMDGPPMRIQRLMQSPQRNHKELFSWLKENPGLDVTPVMDNTNPNPTGGELTEGN